MSAGLVALRAVDQNGVMSTPNGAPDDPTGDLPSRRPETQRSFETHNDFARHASGGAVESPGDTIGPYRLLEAIGEGGFGVVYLAERREPMVQRVALKVIKPGMDTKAVVARFEQERQALAVMDHPNVARVLDGGVTPTGRPYFVMELVKGQPITAFADRQRLTIRERLEVFIPVCEAVQHAHMKGLIHRDNKPSNILVAPGGEGNAPVVKVIDFGVSKAISQTLTDRTIFTEQGQIIGTPEYMSPEQAEMGLSDIDTRTDVYSLGVVLYELLSGTLPFDSKTLRGAGYAEIQRIIREVDAPRPSAKLSTADDKTGGEIAKARQADRERIAGELRRELEWIPMKALRKDRTRRYASAESLAADVRRYLEGKPLEAAPESQTYLLRKFVRRNRVQVAAAGAVAFALVVGVAATGLALDRALAAEAGLKTQLAETVKAQVAERERADQLKKVSEFQSRMLSQIDTTKAGADLMADVRARFAAALESTGRSDAEVASQASHFDELLQRVNATDAAAALIDRTILRPAIETIGTQFKDDPSTDASLRQALADLYCMIGRYDAAFPLQESALATRRRVLGEEHPDTLTAIHNMGSVLKKLGRLDEAEPYHREALEKSRRALGEEHPDTLASLSSMGSLLSVQGKLAEAEPLYREALDRRRRVLGEEHPDTLVSISNMGFLLGSLGKLDEAEPFHREGLEKSRRVLGEEHRDTLGAIRNMGGVLRAQGRLAEAEPYYREALAKSRRVLGEDHPETLTSINNMGGLLRAQGKLAEAEPFTREALEKRRRLLGEEHPETLTSINNTAALLLTLGKLAEAEPLFREALERRRRVLGEEHPETIISIGNMGFLLRAQGNLAEAEPYLREAVEKSRRTLGEEHPNTLVGIGSLARLLQQQRRYQDVVDLLAPIEASARKTLIGSNPTQLAGFLAALGRARAGIGSDAERLALAEANLIEGHAIFLAANGFGPAHRDTLDCVQALVDLYTAWHTAESGKGYDAKAEEWRARLPTKPTGSEP